VPAAVAGVAFLSDGQPAALATSRLNAMHLRSTSHGLAPAVRSPTLPWPVTFSFGRALQQPSSSVWAGADSNHIAAQRALRQSARGNSVAAQGDWSPLDGDRRNSGMRVCLVRYAKVIYRDL
jgi:fructose-bisphosphate aldolase class I